MIREIKFRGKCLNSGEWAYGVPLESKFNCVYMLSKKGGLNADFINSRYTILDSKDSIPTDKNTIGQFTGLKDKNGVDIYEGDVVHWKSYTNLLRDLDSKDRDSFEIFELNELKGDCVDDFKTDVVFEDSSFFVKNEKFDLYLDAFFGDQRNNYPIYEIEVIGNIHEKCQL